MLNAVAHAPKPASKSGPKNKVKRVEIPQPDDFPPQKHPWIHKRNFGKLLDTLVNPSDIKARENFTTTKEHQDTLKEFYSLLLDALASTSKLVKDHDYTLWKQIQGEHRVVGLLASGVTDSLLSPNRWKDGPGPGALQRVSKDLTYNPPKGVEVPASTMKRRSHQPTERES